MFTRENTKELKGIAVLLMFAHHLYAFADRIPYGMEVATPIMLSSKELTVIIGLFGQICVSIFFFLGGYGLFAALHEEKGDRTKCLTKDIARLYISYWKVFLIFIPLGFLCFHDQFQYADADLCFKFANLSWNEVIANFIGWSCSLNIEWWFFKAYLFTLFEGYIFLELFKNKRNVYLECGAAVIWHIFLADVFPAAASLEQWQRLGSDIWYSNLLQITSRATVFLIGIIFAKYDIFRSWQDMFVHWRRLEKTAVSLFVVALVIYIRVFFASASLDMILVPVFIVACMMLLQEVGFLQKFFLILGKNSTNMWLVHSFYCYYFYPFVRLVYGSKNAVISMVVLIALSLASSILIDHFWKYVSIVYHKVRTVKEAG